MTAKLPRLHLPEKADADYRTWIKSGACPECNNSNYIEAVKDEDTYVDDEATYLTQFGPRSLPYKLYACGYCGTQFRVILGTVGIEITQDPDVDYE